MKAVPHLLRLEIIKRRLRKSSKDKVDCVGGLNRGYGVQCRASIVIVRDDATPHQDSSLGTRNLA